jgi:hypothetical protein
MISNLIAGLVVGAHFAWILFLVLGMPVLAWFNLRRLRIFHFAALAGTVVMQATGTVCPLTHLEAALRSGGEASVYPGRFITESLESVIYVDDFTLKAVQALTISLLAATALSFYFRPLPKKKGPSDN